MHDTISEGHRCIALLTVLCFHFVGLVDEQQKVRTITALALAALAEAATPYGIESFDSVLKPLWKGIRQHRGKVCSTGNISSRCDTSHSIDFFMSLCAVKIDFWCLWKYILNLFKYTIF